MDYGFRVSLPGKDVLSCAEKDLVITSKAPCLKIMESGRVDFNSSNITLSVRHATPLPFIVLAYYYNSAVEAWQEPATIQFDESYLYLTIQTEDIMTNPYLIYFILYG